MTEEQTSQRRANVWRAMQRGFREAYDHLGYVVSVTFTTFVVTAVLLSAISLSRSHLPPVAQAALVLPVLLFYYLCAVGVFYYAGKTVSHEHPAIRDTLTGVRILLWPALRLFFADLLITAVIAGDAAFFIRWFVEGGGWASVVLAVLFGYLLLVWLMMLMYHLPLLVAQLRLETPPGVLVVLRKSFLLTADNPGFTVMIFLAIIAFAAACVAPMLIGIAVLYLGATAFLLTHALRELLIKYGLVEEEPEVVEDDWSLPESWRKREREEET